MKKNLLRIIVCLGILLPTFSTIGTPYVSADAPTEPSMPYPAQGSSGVTIFITLHWESSGSDITYDIYFGTENQPPLVASNQSITMYDPGILTFNTIYYWQVIAYNSEQENTPGPVWSFLTADDEPPFKPMIVEGPPIASSGIALNYTAVAPDPEGDEVFYQWDWGDGNRSTWLGPYSFGEQIVASNRWAQNGNYNIKVRAKDSHGKISDWSSAYSISIGSQIHFSALKPGYILINLFGFDVAYGYIQYLDLAGISLIIGTLNSEFTVNVTVSNAVHKVVYKMENLLYTNEKWTAVDDNVTDNKSTGYFSMSPGLYEATAFAYDVQGNLIGQSPSQYLVYYQWKFTLLKALFNRITNGKIRSG